MTKEEAIIKILELLSEPTPAKRKQAFNLGLEYRITGIEMIKAYKEFAIREGCE